MPMLGEGGRYSGLTCPGAPAEGMPMPPHVGADFGIQGVLVTSSGILIDFLDGSRVLMDCRVPELPRAGLLAGQLNCHIGFHDFGRGVPIGTGLAHRN